MATWEYLVFVTRPMSSSPNLVESANYLPTYHIHRDQGEIIGIVARYLPEQPVGLRGM